MCIMCTYQHCLSRAAATVECALSAAGASCADVQVPAGSDGSFTCAQQQGFGKCNESWMLAGNYCAKTCGRCSSSSGAATPRPTAASTSSTPKATATPIPSATCEMLLPSMKDLHHADICASLVRTHCT